MVAPVVTSCRREVREEGEGQEGRRRVGWEQGGRQPRREESRGESRQSRPRLVVTWRRGKRGEKKQKDGEEKGTKDYYTREYLRDILQASASIEVSQRCNKFYCVENCVEKLVGKLCGKICWTIVWENGWEKYTVYSLQCTMYSKVVLLSLWREPQCSTV